MPHVQAVAIPHLLHELQHCSSLGLKQLLVHKSEPALRVGIWVQISLYGKGLKAQHAEISLDVASLMHGHDAAQHAPSKLLSAYIKVRYDTCIEL